MYGFTVELYVAVYVASAVTLLLTAGVHQLNVYVYCCVAALVGSAGNTKSSL